MKKRSPTQPFQVLCSYIYLFGTHQSSVLYLDETPSHGTTS